MDYNRPLNASKANPKVHIGLILVPGIHTGSEKASKSPLLLNPGMDILDHFFPYLNLPRVLDHPSQVLVKFL
jgi:hypothetical protein